MSKFSFNRFFPSTSSGGLGASHEPFLSEKPAYTKLESIPESDSDSIDGTIASLVNRQVKHQRRISWTLIFIFAIINVTSLGALYAFVTRQLAMTPIDASSEIFPATQYHSVTFHETHLRPGPETDALWEAELPRGHGFTLVDEPDRYGLPQGMPHGDGFNRYGVTWAHQYHCLWMLREEFQKLVAANSSLVGVDLDAKSADGFYLWHLTHCFGYLRQMVVCNMDMTLEYPTLKGANEGTINGYGIPHQCKRRDIIDGYMEEHAPGAEEVLRHQHSHGVEMADVHINQ